MKPKLYATHVHTTHSDGLAFPKDIAKIIKQSKEFEGVITSDHDTLTSIIEIESECRRAGVIGIGAVEFGCKFESRDEILVEVLGIGVNPQDASLIDICQRNADFRENRMYEMLERLNYNESLNVSMQDIKRVMDGDVPISRNHLAQVLVKKGKADTVNTAFELYLEPEPFSPYSCFVRRDAVPIKEVIKSIIKAGGVVDIAHPANIAMEHPDMQKPYMDYLISEAKKGHIHAVDICYPYEWQGKLGTLTQGAAKEHNKRWKNNLARLRKVSSIYIVGLSSIDWHGKPKGLPLTSMQFANTRHTIDKLIRYCSKAKEYRKQIKELKK
ncbi:MAG: hypothetical protein U9R08_05145 [Nanoarchaeota archaeon]|nr:hypothetical protein [Nanoarchaeota archaeon]